VNRFLVRFFSGIKGISNMPETASFQKDVRENILLAWKEYNFKLLIKSLIPEDIKTYIENIVVGRCRGTLEKWGVEDKKRWTK